MKNFRSPLPLAGWILAGVVTLSPSAPLLAIHAKNAGPENVEIRFKLPVPKPLTPEEELATFKLPPGFHAELVAAEPMIESPVALSWDEKGRLFVCEMRGYMQDIEAAGEDQPNGRVVLLEDTDGDGKMDKRTIFADQLVMPRAILWTQGGLLVAEPPNLLFLRDTDGDGVADAREIVDDSFGKAGGQPEHMANSLTHLLDNWISAASHGKRYRFKDGKFVSETTGLRGQWGLTQDNFGRPYFNSNSDFLRANLVPESLAGRNPNFAATAGLGVQILKSQNVWPSHPTPGVNRGYAPKTLRDDGTLAQSTATCGAAIYRGSLFPKDFRGNAFIPEPAGNLVKRVLLSEKDGIVTGTNATEESEFWTSTDERFRPVNAYSGPEGALYVVDLYRGIIQHKGFLTHYLAANIKDRQLETPFNQGRIWRIVPDQAKPARVSLPTESEKLIGFLAHPDGWVRDHAQRLLVEKRDTAVIPSLAAMAQKGKTALARLHALWTLEGLNALAPETLSACLKDSDSKVRATAVRLLGRPQLAELVPLIADPSADVQVALGFQLSTYPETQDGLLKLASQCGSQALVRDAILSGLRGRELEFLQALLQVKAHPAPAGIVQALAQAVMKERQKERVKTLLELTASQPANSPSQIALLTGLSGKSGAPKTASPGKSAPPIKFIYLENQPQALVQLLDSADKTTKPLVAALDAQLAWPGKPGVPPPPVVKPLTEAELALFETGRGVYNSICAGCHQPNGAGMAGLAPALVDSEWVLGNPEVLPRIVLHGLAGPIKVAGQSWNLEMPPMGAALNDDQLAGVLTFIRRSWEHTASPISPSMVAKIRQANSGRTKSWTADEIRTLQVANSPKKPSAAPAADAEGSASPR
ncbi:MAG: hypothetical protein RLZZ399_1832 [Verrucomicrobiota bacterium]|jgi:glucose/arabinose dehydrogenase/mono/diheme cytochrome c family protein